MTSTLTQIGVEEMSVHETALEIASAAYKTIESGTSWADFLSCLVSRMQYQWAAIGFQDSIDRPFISATGYGLSSELLAEFDETITHVNPFFKPAMERPLGQHVNAACELIPRTALTETLYYDWMQRAGSEDIILALEKTAERGMITLGLYSKLGEFVTEQELEIMRVVMPHVFHAISLKRQLARLELERDVYQLAFDRAGVGVILVSGSARVEWANRYADHIFRCEDAVTVRHDRLVAVDEASAHRLESALDAAIGISDGQILSPRPIIELNRVSSINERPVEALVSPVAPFGHPLLGPVRGALIFLADPNHLDEGIAGRLEQRYKLTPTEAEIAQWLMSGSNAASIAEIFGNSPATVRTHIKRIMSKCGVNSQAALVGVLHRGLVRLA